MRYEKNANIYDMHSNFKNMENSMVLNAIIYQLNVLTFQTKHRQLSVFKWFITNKSKYTKEGNLKLQKNKQWIKNT